MGLRSRPCGGSRVNERIQLIADRISAMYGDDNKAALVAAIKVGVSLR